MLNFRNLQWGWLSIIFMLLDMWSKNWIKNNFFLGEIFCLSSYCNFHYIYNSGLAFGLFVEINFLFYRWFLICFIILLIVVLVISLYESMKCNNKYYCFAYSMIIGGALGNLCDRIIYGAVVDFIDFHIGNWHWPIFNVADAEICIGVVFLMMRYCHTSVCKKMFSIF